MISSLLKNPASSGKPLIERVPIKKVQNVIGRPARRLPMWRMSWSSWKAWMTLPAAMKSRALKNAWVMKWNMPAA